LWKKRFVSQERLEDIAQQIVGRCNRIVNESVPIVDARLENGARVNIVMPPVALGGPVITIRRFPDQPIQMEQLVRWGTVTREVVDFLEKLVCSGYNIFISGGTGSGKTTFMNALSNYIPKDERIITIEDNAELQIQGVKNLVRLEARNANTEGEKAITIRDLIRSSLRMRPDRILIGEVRGSEAIDLLQAMNTGHDGSISTGHANSPEDMLSRLETMVLMGMEIPLPAVRRQIASGIDIIVHVGRMRDKSRKVLQVLEILGFDSAAGEIRTQVLYEFEEEGEDEWGTITGKLTKKADLSRQLKLQRAGYHI
jgi:pilus assembly protein CpaF